MSFRLVFQGFASFHLGNLSAGLASLYLRLGSFSVEKPHSFDLVLPAGDIKKCVLEAMAELFL